MIDIENYPEVMSLKDSEPIVNALIEQTINEIEYQAGATVRADEILCELSEKDSIYTYNPEDPDDEEDFVDMITLNMKLDQIMWEKIAEIKEEQEEETMINLWEKLGEELDDYLENVEPEEEVEYYEPEDLEMGFNPYLGGYDYDC